MSIHKVLSLGHVWLLLRVCGGEAAKDWFEDLGPCSPEGAQHEGLQGVDSTSSPGAITATAR